ncbi:CAP domain-containing protein [Rhizobium sp. RU36D]|uniref:CAP domain-containing protein n=1 Tax=Rhizobium sp. RU36D TaxID=1907415 RepID=UPI0009D8A629|nr:CAP domain-containing protein [Rhizobium sp. RU36D]SMD19909.1 Uncharacterized conserved protein YkwD, contains CAP (CSP/antigen 5/PR1) domain [Rhizobium sp. RU36D]
MPSVSASRRHTLMLMGFALSAPIVLTLSGCTVREALDTRDMKDARDETAAALPIVNGLRREKGLGSLRQDPAATVAAIEQARRMASAGKMSHLIGFNDDFGARMKRSRVQLPAAENIATGQDTVQRAVQAWIDSRKHLENMLGGYNGLGVAVAISPASDNRPFWAMVLSA